MLSEAEGSASSVGEASLFTLSAKSAAEGSVLFRLSLCLFIPSGRAFIFSSRILLRVRDLLFAAARVR